MNKYIKRLSFIPFVLGFIGYYYVGKVDFGNAIYATILIYFLNPVSDVDNLLVLSAKILGVFVTTSFIIVEFSRFSSRLRRFALRFFPDATMIYSNLENRKSLAKIFRHVHISDLSETKVYAHVNCHFIAFNQDVDTIHFFEENREDLKNKKVYLLFHEMDSFLPDFKEIDVHVVNINDLLARTYWRKYHLYDALKKDKKMCIAIIGKDNAARAIFKYAYLNNLYFLEQEIEYHLWGLRVQDISFIKNLRMDNGDVVKIHEEDYLQSLEEISAMSRVILVDEWEIGLIQNLLFYNPQLEIHFYSDIKIELATFFGSERVLSFGEIQQRFTEDGIKKEQIYRGGKLFNFDYELRKNGIKSADVLNFEMEMENAWKELSAFKKSSSLARADHHWIDLRLKSEFPEHHEAYFWELEHIRWCRFHYINNWHYASKRSDSAREHPLLVPFEQLTHEEMSKDGVYDEKIKMELETTSI